MGTIISTIIAAIIATCAPPPAPPVDTPGPFNPAATLDTAQVSYGPWGVCDGIVCPVE